MNKLSAFLHGERAAARGRRSGTLLIVCVVLALLSAGCGGLTSVPAPPAPPEPYSGARIYWTDAGKNTIGRAALNGSRVEDLLAHGLNEPYGIALAVAGGKMYWADWDQGIQCANLDGTGVETLVRTYAPNGIALDVAAGKMYWTDYRANTIRRANLDGSNVEDLVVTSLGNPYGIALDVAGGKMYWTDAGTEKIQRADLNGSHVEDLVIAGLDSPRGIALDVAAGKLYWTDRSSDKIQRANLDGSGVEDLVTTESPSHRDGLALDVASGKMYWTERRLGKIQRANLDGTGIEDVLASGLQAPYEVAAGCRRRQDLLDRLGDGNPPRQPGRHRLRVPGGLGGVGSARHCPGYRRWQDLRDGRIPGRSEAERDSALQPGRHRWRRPHGRGHVRRLRHCVGRRWRQDILDGIGDHLVGGPHPARRPGRIERRYPGARSPLSGGDRAGCRRRQDVLDGPGNRKDPTRQPGRHGSPGPGNDRIVGSPGNRRGRCRRKDVLDGPQDRQDPAPPTWTVPRSKIW